MKNPSRILFVDDHPLAVEGLRSMLQGQCDLVLVGTATSATEAFDQFVSLSPDVTVLDLQLPDAHGVTAIEKIRAHSPEARIVVVSIYSGDADIKRALDAGAMGYLFKGARQEVLLDSIRKVATGERFLPPDVKAALSGAILSAELTAREIEVLNLVASGKNNEEISHRLFVSIPTVKFHVRNILMKLGASDRTQAVVAAVRRGLVHLQ